MGACRDRGLKGIGPMYPSCATGWPSYARRAILERSLQQQAQAQSSKRAFSASAAAAASDPWHGWHGWRLGSAQVRWAGCAVAFGSCCSYVCVPLSPTHPRRHRTDRTKAHQLGRSCARGNATEAQAALTVCVGSIKGDAIGVDLCTLYVVRRMVRGSTKGTRSRGLR